jgi:hypothetical protein
MLTEFINSAFLWYETALYRFARAVSHAPATWLPCRRSPLPAKHCEQL